MHFLNPISKRVHDELENAGMSDIERISAAGEVDVARAVGGIEPVVAGVIDSAQGEEGAGVVALGGVVVNNIEHDLDACRVEGAHHFLEFSNGIFRSTGAIARVGHEVAEGVVAPIIREAAIRQMLFVRVEMDRQEFDSGDAEALQVRDGSFASEAGIGASEFFGNLGVTLGEALHMKFVEDGFVPGCVWRWGAIPVESGIVHAG